MKISLSTGERKIELEAVNIKDIENATDELKKIYDIIKVFDMQTQKAQNVYSDAFQVHRRIIICRLKEVKND